MGVHALRCTIQSNMGTDVRVCNVDKGAKFEMYAKDVNMMGSITSGFHDYTFY